MASIPRHIEKYGLLFVCESESSENQRHDGDPRSRAVGERELVLLRRYLIHISSQRVLNTEDAEDLVQETLLTFIARRPQVQLHKGLVPWCCGVLRRKVGNYYRKSLRRASLRRLFPATARNAGPGVAAFTPELRLFQKELHELMIQMISRLPPMERRPMEMLMAGHPVWEIANQLHPERYQNVVNRLHRSRKKLNREFARRGYSTLRGVL